MKVLLAIGSLGGGGAERVMTWLADALVRHGDSVCLLTRRDDSSDFYPLNAAVRRVAVGYGRYLDSSAASVPINRWRWRHALRTAARQDGPDVVLSFIDRTNLSVLVAFAGSGIPVVVAERTDPRHSLLKRWHRGVRPHLYRHLAARVVVQTETVAARTRREWRLPSVDVVPNAVTMTAGDAAGPAARAMRVLSVGRLAREKGHDLLIEAWSRLHPQFPGWELRIVGDGPLRSALQAQVARLGLERSVTLPGAREDVAGEYRDASIFALPSRFEGFPNALLEAMACGCAVVATTAAGASVDLIEPGVNGTLVPAEDVEALAAALGRLMLDRDLRQRYAERATAVSSRYAPERVFQLWRQVLVAGAAR